MTESVYSWTERKLEMGERKVEKQEVGGLRSAVEELRLASREYEGKLEI